MLGGGRRLTEPLFISIEFLNYNQPGAREGELLYTDTQDLLDIGQAHEHLFDAVHFESLHPFLQREGT